MAKPNYTKEFDEFFDKVYMEMWKRTIEEQKSRNMSLYFNEKDKNFCAFDSVKNTYADLNGRKFIATVSFELEDLYNDVALALDKIAQNMTHEQKLDYVNRQTEYFGSVERVIYNFESTMLTWCKSNCPTAVFKSLEQYLLIARSKFKKGQAYKIIVELVEQLVNPNVEQKLTAKQRVKNEHSALKLNIDKLGKFLTNPKFEELSLKSRSLLVQQHSVMTQYADILKERLDCWEELSND